MDSKRMFLHPSPDRPELSAKLAELRPVARPVSNSVVTRLEELLAEAKEGEIESFAIAYRRPDGTMDSMATDTDNKHALIAGMRYLEYRMIRQAYEED